MDNEPVRIDYKDKQKIVLMGQGRKWLFIEKEPGMLVPVDPNGFILFKEEFEKLIRGADNFFTEHTEIQISRHNDREKLEMPLFDGMNNLNQVPFRKIEDYEKGLNDSSLNHKYHIPTVEIREEILSEIEWEYYKKYLNWKNDRQLHEVSNGDQTFGSVYIINSINTATLYKIGSTRRRLDARIKELQTGCPDELRLVHLIRTTHPEKLEKEIHSRYAHKRLQGEWFELEKEDLELIKDIYGWVRLRSKRKIKTVPVCC